MGLEDTLTLSVLPDALDFVSGFVLLLIVFSLCVLIIQQTMADPRKPSDFPLKCLGRMKPTFEESLWEGSKVL